MISPSSAQHNILATLTYYDIFDLPLTEAELFKYFILSDRKGTSPSSSDIQQLLSLEKIKKSDNFYFLPGREHLIAVRHRRERIALPKLRLARNICRWLALIPSIRAIFISGSLALKSTDHHSDLDIFIIARSGHIWSTRLFALGITTLLGRRRKPGQRLAPDRACLNHYIADDALSILNQNVFMAQTLARMLVVYSDGSAIVEQFAKTNIWTKQYIRQFDLTHEEFRQSWLEKLLRYIWKAKLKIAGNWLENHAKTYQLSRIERNPITQNPNGRLEYTDQRLEFHPDSMEHDVLSRYESKLTI